MNLPCRPPLEDLPGPRATHLGVAIPGASKLSCGDALGSAAVGRPLHGWAHRVGVVAPRVHDRLVVCRVGAWRSSWRRLCWASGDVGLARPSS
jgi:hypothetical protein